MHTHCVVCYRRARWLHTSYTFTPQPPTPTPTHIIALKWGQFSKRWNPQRKTSNQASKNASKQTYKKILQINKVSQLCAASVPDNLSKHDGLRSVFVCVRARARACVCACARACVCVCEGEYSCFMCVHMDRFYVMFTLISYTMMV